MIRATFTNRIDKSVWLANPGAQNDILQQVGGGLGMKLVSEEVIEVTVEELPDGMPEPQMEFTAEAFIMTRTELHNIRRELEAIETISSAHAHRVRAIRRNLDY